MKIYLNGKILPERRAHISIHDRGFLSGDGVYETLRVYNGRVFLLEEHLARLKRSLAGIFLTPPQSLRAIGAAIEMTVKANRHKDASVRITVTRGPGPHGFDPRPCKNPTTLIVSRPFGGYPVKQMTAAVVSVRRNSPEALPPSIKSISCLNNILAKIEAVRGGADEAIMLSDDGGIAEGTVSNVFIVKRGLLSTPAQNGRQLAGVTRDLVCRLARENGVRLSETRLSVRDLTGADEVFLTSSLMEIMPVSKIMFSGETTRLKPGPVTADLADAYRRFKMVHSAPSKNPTFKREK